MKVLLVSTYELGRQPVHVASPMAALGRAGHEVRAVDTSTDGLTEATLGWADAIALSVPMHTAKRLADELAAQIKEVRPQVPVAHYGLYAAVGSNGGRHPVDATFEGEYEPALLEWIERLGTDTGFTGNHRHLGRSDFEVPDRSDLPPLQSYARLDYEGEMRLAGAVEASHGCRHRCRHCPIPAVYDGRMRVVPKDVVLADIDQLARSGARHVTFGDPDFLNAPRHSVDILEAAHSAHPDMTFDVTVKVEHILKHENLWERMARLNLLFVVSAFESVDEPTLQILDKGHTVADMTRAVEVMRAVGIHVRPTWLPFMPWTRTDHVVELVSFLDANDLNGATDPVQLAIKLLIPGGSLLEDHPAVVPHLSAYDPRALTWDWTFSDPGAERLQKELESIAAEASECGHELTTTLGVMRAKIADLTGHQLGPLPATKRAVPRLTESWFCCAEPTSGQGVSVRIGSR